ncbi:PD-(D/E)XK nuclease domain-containing protein [Sorangium sp. So ce394]|uniref:PD-(D/E)XK nuclease domain-containing protein n=1 Tax=Sorangium sp. So ce394 TaxID=3133310 RepID=UPI003F5AE85B
MDEYDEPIHAGFVGGYAREVLDFFRAFLTGGIKDNPHLARAVLTGILRVARESIFSGLNNIGVYSLLRTEFSTCFGFTEPEVLALLTDGDALDRLESVRRAYNGYVFGETVVYNPWSVLSFLASDDRRTRSYWVSTSANELIRDLLVFHALDVEDDIAVLLEGGAIEQRLDENVALDQLPGSPRALFALLVFSGYLRAEATEAGTTHVPSYRLSIPNEEVREVYTSTFRDWMAERLSGQGASSRRLVRALLGGDAATFEEQLRAFVTNVLSYHEARRLGPEEVYHGFVAGLLATLEPDYEVRSNRESGEGRPDVLVRPRQPGKPGVVLEMKVARGGQTLEQALDEGIAQIARRDYTAELRAAGASPVHALAVAFNGKQVAVREAAGISR